MDSKEIKLYIDDESFLYDVQGLVMAFYPGRKPVTVSTPEDADIVVGVADITGDIADRRSKKNKLKKELYDRFSVDTKRELPWGTLTGVRPTKIVLRLITDGMDRDRVISHLMDEYLTSFEKSKLAVDIAFKEAGMIEGATGYPYGTSSDDSSKESKPPVCLYIGIPFCPSICLYCSFSSYAIGAYRDSVDAYIDALTKEIRDMSGTLSDRRIAAIYFGGGTPTSLLADQLSRILETVRQSFDLAHIAEYTVEAGRPDSITAEKLSVLDAYGVGRISINPQTLQQRTLDTIGRRHSVDDFYRAYRLARDYPFIINTDLIVGLPGEGEAEVRDTLSHIKELSPDNLTVHSLAKKRASRLTEEWELYAADSFVYTDEIERLVYSTAGELRMEPYYMYRQKNIAGNMENVGFAQEKAECIYNVLMMEEACDIAAFGAGAVSKRLPVYDGINPYAKADRQKNPKDVKNYIERIDEIIQKKTKFFSDIPCKNA